MVKTPTYRDQFDKLTRAYINNEVYAWRGCACFIGNLLNGNGDWEYARGSGCNLNKEKGLACILKEGHGLYATFEIFDLEKTFMGIAGRVSIGADNYEDELFRGFETCLEELRQIHISKGEIIDETPVFKKRKLQIA